MTAIARATLSSIASRHAIPFCRIVGSQTEFPVWIDNNSKPVDSIVIAASPEPYENTPTIDIKHEAGLRLWYSGNTLWFQYHHQCADGRGALQLENDFLELVFAERRSEDSISATQPTPTQFIAYRSRTRVRLTLLGAIVRSTLGWWYLWQGIHRRVIPFPSSKPSSSAPVAMKTLNRQLDVEATQECLNRSRRQRVSLNDIVLAAVFVWMHDVYKRHSQPTSDVFRIVVPIDMRTPADRKMGCANKMSFLYLDMLSDSITNSAGFLRRISRRMRFLRKYMGLVVWRSIYFGPRQVERLRQFLRQQPVMLSCYVSNLGVIDRCSPHIVDFEATPTLRQMDTPLALMVYSFDGKLHLTAGFDSRRLDEPAVSKFLTELTAAMIAGPGDRLH